MSETNPLEGVLDAIRGFHDQHRRELAKGPKGSPSNPYDLIVPGWVEDLCLAEGKTAQQAADDTLVDLNGRRVATKVTVVR